MIKKKCTKCLIEKELNDYYIHNTSNDGHRTQCIFCTQLKRKKTYQYKRKGYSPKYRQAKIKIKVVDKESQKLYQQQYRQLYKIEISYKKKIEHTQAKIEGLQHYGNKCSCCNESIQGFLTLEHINGAKRVNGKRRTGKAAWLQAKRAKWPNDLTILCFNCNCAKGIYSICPHKLEK